MGRSGAGLVGGPRQHGAAHGLRGGSPTRLLGGGPVSGLPGLTRTGAGSGDGGGGAVDRGPECHPDARADGGPRRRRPRLEGHLAESDPGPRPLGSAVASCTAAYTLWDAFAVAELHVAVVPYMALSSLAQFVLLTIVLGRRRRELPAALAAGWTRALPIAVLVPASYALVLVAMRFGPPSVVATSRSLNVVFGVIAGVWLLREPFTRRSILGVSMIVVGVLVGAS